MYTRYRSDHCQHNCQEHEDLHVCLDSETPDITSRSKERKIRELCTCLGGLGRCCNATYALTREVRVGKKLGSNVRRTLEEREAKSNPDRFFAQRHISGTRTWRASNFGHMREKGKEHDR